jgi:hypothetical protein
MARQEKRTMKALVLIAALASVAAQAQTCTREGLKAIAANYFKAVETHQPSALAMAATVRITENAAEIKAGEGFFKTGGKAQLQRTIVDTAKCSTLTQAVVDENAAGKTGPVLMAVRLKSEGGKVSEIETIIARTGDFAFKPQGVLDTRNQDWATLMPAAQRRTREFLNGQADKYYEMFVDHKVDPGFALPCNRWENGTLTTAKGDCSWNGAVMTHPRRRFPVTDVELGVAAAITNFRDDWLDVHIFKFNQDGKIELIQAVDGPGTKGTGWPADKTNPY